VIAYGVNIYTDTNLWKVALPVIMRLDKLSPELKWEALMDLEMRFGSHLRDLVIPVPPWRSLGGHLRSSV
jgi:hypothetical protein